MPDECEEAEAADAILDIARREGVDLASVRVLDSFNNGRRMIFVWMDGTRVGYSIQGRIADLPALFTSSASAFYGMWSEYGNLPDIRSAFTFVKAWVLDGIEVDQLPIPEREIMWQAISGV